MYEYIVLVQRKNVEENTNAPETLKQFHFLSWFLYHANLAIYKY